MGDDASHGNQSAEHVTLTWPIVAAVLFGALLHAGWNALVKSSSDKALDTALLSLIGCVTAVPVVLVVGLPVPATWPWLAASIAIHIFYYSLLTAAYRHGDLGLTYPLMRGAAPLLVAVMSTLSFGETLTPLAWVGVLGVSAGVLALGLSRHAMESPRAVGFALANALVIAAYTVVDGLGVRASGHALQYVATLFMLNGLPFGVVVLARRGWGTVLPYAQRRAPLAFIGALASFGSYAIALWAMTRAPVATIAALRETSVLFAALLGTWLLKEAFTLRRAIGTAAILAGVMALRLG
jgi:phosphonate utilization associated putative membrane protein